MSSLSKQTLPKGAEHLLKSLRRYAYVCLEPLDYVARIVNGKKDFPPLHLRRYVGPLRTFEMSGAEFMVHLQTICNLQPRERVFDIGCGCGLMALHLLDFLDSQGGYAGVDVHKPSVTWCQRNIGDRYQNFEFAHIDFQNDVYNSRGVDRSSNFAFPFADQTFDCILLKSVFTHMRPEAVDCYLKEAARLLAPRGHCLATFFLLNEQQESLARRGLNRLQFNYGDAVWRYAQKNSPESAVAFNEDYVRELLRKNGLTLARPTLYGRWAGLPSGLSFQDMMLLQRQ